MIVWSGGSVLGKVIAVKGGVIEILSGGWDDSVSKTNLWWSTGDLHGFDVVWVVVVVSSFNGGEESSDGKEFHNIELKK